MAAGGFGCCGRGDCAGSDAEKAKPAIAVNRIGVRRFIVNVGRAAAVEVTPSWRVLRTVYREFAVTVLVEKRISPFANGPGRNDDG